MHWLERKGLCAYPAWLNLCHSHTISFGWKFFSEKLTLHPQFECCDNAKISHPNCLFQRLWLNRKKSTDRMVKFLLLGSLSVINCQDLSHQYIQLINLSIRYFIRFRVIELSVSWQIACVRQKSVC
jgi:hypothetical protein